MGEPKDVRKESVREGEKATKDALRAAFKQLVETKIDFPGKPKDWDELTAHCNEMIAAVEAMKLQRVGAYEVDGKPKVAPPGTPGGPERGGPRRTKKQREAARR